MRCGTPVRYGWIEIAMTRGVHDGVRRVAGTNGNRYEDVMELAEMAP